VRGVEVVLQSRDTMEPEPSELKEGEKAPESILRKNKKVLIWVWILLGVSAILAGYVYLQNIPPPFGLYDAFAKCIASTTTKFYGAWWCPHCRDQKTKFGDAAAYLPYVECATPDASGQTQACIDAGIKSYPTWQFPDGSRLVGVTALATISEKTGCELPTSTPKT
jgi:hypothetical protein